MLDNRFQAAPIPARSTRLSSTSFRNAVGVNMAYKIQHLGLGGILDQAISIVKDHFGLLFTIMLLLLIPFNLITGGLGLALMPDITTVNPTLEDQMRIAEEQMKYLPIFSVLGFINALIILPLTNAAVIWAVAELYLGQPVTAMEALRHGLRRLPALIGTSILMYLAIFGGLLLFIIPGILFALWFGLSQHVVIIEGLSGPTALGRSKKLVRPHLGTFLVLGILMFVIFAILGAAGLFIPQPHVQLVVSTLINAVGTMVMTAAGVVFYFSCRCAEENFDLHYLAQSIGGEAAATDDQAIPAAR
jgi:hypothetical protein